MRTRVTVSKDARAAAAAAYQYGGLRIESTPPGAEISVNGKPVGKAPVVVDSLPVGEVKIDAKLSGYESMSSIAKISARAMLSSDMVLKERPFPQGRWEFDTTYDAPHCTTASRSWIRIEGTVGYSGWKNVGRLKKNSYWNKFAEGDMRRYAPSNTAGTKRDYEYVMEWADNKIICTSQMTPASNFYDEVGLTEQHDNRPRTAVWEVVGEDIKWEDDLYKKVK